MNRDQQLIKDGGEKDVELNDFIIRINDVVRLRVHFWDKEDLVCVDFAFLFFSNKE